MTTTTSAPPPSVSTRAHIDDAIEHLQLALATTSPKSQEHLRLVIRGVLEAAWVAKTWPEAPKPEQHAGSVVGGVMLSPQEFYGLAVSAVRYAMGRATYVVHEVCTLVRAHHHVLTPPQRTVLRRDIQRRLDEARADDRKVGMDVDDQEWLELVELLEDPPTTEAPG